MTVYHTPNSSAERKRADRFKIARRLYKALVAKDPDRVITLYDASGRLVARNEPLPIHDAPLRPLLSSGEPVKIKGLQHLEPFRL